METRGIDVSYFQGDINWAEVANDNVNFAMIRASYGTSGVDLMFEKNMQGIKNTQIYPGAYHYCYALNTEEAKNEARHFINIIKPYAFYYPVALDLEEESIAELGREAVTDIIIAFTNVLKTENFYPILYVDLNWIRNYINMNRISDLDIWLSEWGNQMQYSRNVTMWQYRSDGQVRGINGEVDLNISYKDYPSIIKEKGLNGTNGGSGSKPGVDTNPSVNVYRVETGDTLWGIAKHFLGDGNKYREIMVLNGLTSDNIVPGQILEIPMNNIEEFIWYRVRKGDTLWQIAQKYLGDGNKYHEISRVNSLPTDVIYTGQLIKIPIKSENLSTIYTVKEGDSLWNIASRFLGNGNRYRDIMSLNNLSNEVIYPGEKLRIPPR